MQPDRHAKSDHAHRALAQPPFGIGQLDVPARSSSTAGNVVDLFAGAGGWEEGLKALGHRAIGVETDPWACATAVAAGHSRLCADVSDLEPASLGPVWGLIASPPCQAYSSAGRKLGRHDKPRVIACAAALADGRDARPEHRAALLDDRSLLTVEPLRWALALRPRWLAYEQVPSVLELWKIFARLLEGHGYRTAAGVLSAERYGVPQTRRRAFLIASLDGPVALPAPTHRSYNPRRPDVVADGEQNLLPWISMAQALGWAAPAVAVTHANTDSGRRPNGLERDLRYPGRTLDTAAGAWTIEPLPRPRLSSAARERHPTIQPTTEPACEGRAHPPWTARRPATTVMGDPRLQPLGYRAGARDSAGGRRSQGASDPIRLTARQAASLQGFRADYPWQGGRGRQFQQIGNAVCPPVARAVLAEAMAPTLRAQARR
jgi:DNA (cytosine-5)-methyltransferase 1